MYYDGIYPMYDDDSYYDYESSLTSYQYENPRIYHPKPVPIPVPTTVPTPGKK